MTSYYSDYTSAIFHAKFREIPQVSDATTQECFHHVEAHEAELDGNEKLSWRDWSLGLFLDLILIITILILILDNQISLGILLRLTGSTLFARCRSLRGSWFSHSLWLGRGDWCISSIVVNTSSVRSSLDVGGRDWKVVLLLEGTEAVGDGLRILLVAECCNGLRVDL